MNKLLLIGGAVALGVAAGCTTCEPPQAVATKPDVCANVKLGCVGEAVKPWIERGRLPGAISVLYNNGVEEIDCVGYANVETKRPISIDDPFMMCSQTKGFCGVTVAKLVEEGKLNLDDPVSKYLPEFKKLWIKHTETNGVKVLLEARNVLTLRMVLNHTGGFPMEICAKHPRLKGGGWSGGAPLRQTAAIAAACPLMFEPGTKVLYSNTGIDIAAAIVEVVTGMPWEDYLKKEVLDPLGMYATCFKPTDEQLSRMIEMYNSYTNAPMTWRSQSDLQQRPYNGAHVFPSAGAGLWTTTRDQLKFYKMLMNLGKGENGVRILKAKTVKNLLAVSSRPEGFEGYSLGLSAPVVDGENEWFGHGGAWGTSCSVNWHTKQLQMWVVQLYGHHPRPWDKDRDAAADKFFGIKTDKSGTNAYTGRLK